MNARERRMNGLTTPPDRGTLRIGWLPENGTTNTVGGAGRGLAEVSVGDATETEEQGRGQTPSPAWASAARYGRSLLPATLTLHWLRCSFVAYVGTGWGPSVCPCKKTSGAGTYQLAWHGHHAARTRRPPRIHESGARPHPTTSQYGED